MMSGLKRTAKRTGGCSARHQKKEEKQPQRSRSEGNINIGDASVPSSPSNNITAPPDSPTTTNVHLVSFGSESDVQELLWCSNLSAESEDYVAAQLWGAVSALINFSSDSMKVFLASFDVTAAEMSPFCQRFSSMKDLLNAFISFLPRTFTYQNVQGGSVVGENESGENDDDDKDSDDEEAKENKITENVVERIKLFTASMEDDKEEEDDEGGDEVVVVEKASSPTDATVNESDAGSVAKEEKLMTSYRSILTTTGLHPSQRWVARPIDCVVKEGKEVVGVEDILIERDVIILLNVEQGTGAGATVVTRPYRVLEIYEKYYNKWFVSPAAMKIWKKEKKPFKLEVRMLKKNAVDEYSDEDMYGTGFNKDEICRNVEDKLIVRLRYLPADNSDDQPNLPIGSREEKICWCAILPRYLRFRLFPTHVHAV
eukprot:scaffold3077_cov80-Skeletonema_menzelii.AAC.1